MFVCAFYLNSLENDYGDKIIWVIIEGFYIKIVQCAFVSLPICFIELETDLFVSLPH